MKPNKSISLFMSLLFILGLSACKKDDNQKITSSTTSVSTSYDITSEMTTEATTHSLLADASKNNIINNSVINCSDSNFQVSSELNAKIKKTLDNFSKNNDASFELYDLKTGTTFSHDIEEGFNGACIVKTSVVLYLLKLAELGLIDINKEIPYPGNVVSGSGYLNGYYNGYQAYTGKKITIFEYMYHCLYYSDNNAYRILWQYLVNSGYFKDYQNYMSQIDAASLCVSENSMWVRKANAESGVNIMREVYNFYLTSANTHLVDYTFVDKNNLKNMSKETSLTYGQILYWIMANGKYDYIEDKTGNFSISKTGFVSGNGPLSCRNLTSISYGKRDYIICLLTKYKDEYSRKQTVNSLIDELDDVINEYDNYSNQKIKTAN